MPEEFEKALRDAIAKAKARGWSYNALAKAAGIPHPTLSRWMQTEGQEVRKNMTFRNAARLMKFLGMRPPKPRIPKPPE